MTTNLTNIFTSSWLLAVAITSILLVGILAPTAFSQQSTVITFDAPGAGTGPGHTTLAINPAGAITGFYFDAGDAIHGFLRSPDGTIGTIDVPGAGTGPGQGTSPFSITSGGAIAGRYADANNVFSWFPARCGRRDHDV